MGELLLLVIIAGSTQAPPGPVSSNSSCQLRHLWKKDRSVRALVELDTNWKVPIQIIGAIVSATKEGFGVLKRSNTKQRNIGVHLRRIGRHFTNKSSYFYLYKAHQPTRNKDVDQQPSQ